MVFIPRSGRTRPEYLQGDGNEAPWGEGVKHGKGNGEGFPGKEKSTLGTKQVKFFLGTKQVKFFLGTKQVKVFPGN
jgi:hypothetical protein